MTRGRKRLGASGGRALSPGATPEDPGADDPAAESLRHRLQRGLTLAIGRAPGYREALTAVLRKVCDAGDWVLGEAWVASREGSILKPGPAWSGTKAAFRAFRERSRKLGFRRGSDIPGRVLASGSPEWVEDVTAAEVGFSRRTLAREAGLRTAFAVPVRTPQDVVAVLVFFATETRPPDAAAMRAFAGVLASVGPLLEARKIEEELRVRAHQQEAVARLGVQALARSTRLPELMQAAIDTVVRDLGVECGEVLEALPDGDTLVLRAGVGWPAHTVGRLELPTGSGSHAGYALASNETLVVDDFDREKRFTVPSHLAIRDVASGVSVIIHGQERPVGVLGVYTVRRRRFSRNDIHFLQGVANVLGHAIERAHAATALRERESRIRAIVETAVDGIVTIDEQGTIETFNPAAERLFGYPAAEAVGRNVALLIPEHLRARHEAGLAAYARTGHAKAGHGGWETQGLRKDGSRFPMHLSVVRLRLDERVRFVGMVHDLTHQKAVERALERERAFVSGVLDAAGALVAVLDVQGRVLRFNRACETTTGYLFAEVRGRPLWELLPTPAGRDLVRDAFGAVKRGGAPCECECECRTQDGARRRILWHFTALRGVEDEVEYVVAAGLDVTGRRQAEEELERHREHLEKLVEERTRKLESYHEQLRQADRLASMGTLAAGLGHDMHNVLLPVLCRLDALEKGELPPSLRGEVQAIRQSLDFLRQLSRGLRLFALDPDDPEASDQTTDLRAWWKQVAPLLQRALPKEVVFEATIPELPPVRVPEHRLTQAVLNLVVNAGEATGGKGRVRLWVEAVDDEPAVRLCVEDDGHGMSSDVQRHALEPFFTTKKRDLSTGLGLSLVHGVAQSVGGSVSLDSTPGEGTTVRLVLPTTAAPQLRRRPRRRRRKPPPGRTASVSLRNTRTAAIVQTLLRSAGFDVRAAPPTEPGETLLWITETDREGLAVVRKYLAGDLDRRAIVLGRPEGARSRPRLTFVDSDAGLEAGSAVEALRQALRATVHDLVETTDVF